MARIASLLALVLAAIPAPAHATTGGPIVVDILGVDADGKTYWTEAHHDESGIPPALYYLARGATEPVRVRSWYARGGAPSGDDDYEVIATRIDALRSRLAPLPAIPRSEIHVQREITSRGWHRARDLPPLRELHLTVRVAHAASIRDLDLLAYASARVRTTASRRLPDGRALVVIAYQGVPDEGTYERQIAIVLP